MNKFNKYIFHEMISNMNTYFLNSFWANSNDELLLDIKPSEEHIDYFYRTNQEKFNKIIKELNITKEEAFDKSTTVNNKIISMYNWKRINIEGELKIWKICKIEARNLSDSFDYLKEQIISSFPSIETINVYGTDDKYGKHPLRIL